MKKLFALLGFSLLTACITVDDFGEYWDKGGYDTALVGMWQEKESSKTHTISQHGKGYKIKSEAQEPDLARTLTVGKYKYLMMRVKEGKPEGGVLLRYVADKKSAKLYTLASGDKVKAWLDEHYPSKKQFNDEYKDYLTLKTLDPEVIKMLVDIPDTEEYWTVMMELTKVEEK